MQVQSHLYNFICYFFHGLNFFFYNSIFHFVTCTLCFRTHLIPTMQYIHRVYIFNSPFKSCLNALSNWICISTLWIPYFVEVFSPHHHHILQPFPSQNSPYFDHDSSLQFIITLNSFPNHCTFISRSSSYEFTPQFATQFLPL